jgi:signal transduction histidine kinase
MNFKTNFSLLHKTFVPVGIAVAVQLIFLSVIFVLLKQAADELARAKHAQAVRDQGIGLIQDCYQAGTMLISFGATKSMAFDDRYQNLISAIPERVATLENLLSNQLQDRRVLERVKKLVNHLVIIFQETRDSLEETGQVTLFVRTKDFKSELDNIVRQLFADLKGVISEQEAIQHASPLAEDRMRNGVMTMIVLAMIFNLVLLIVIPAFFYRDTRARLKVLMDNTVRFGKKQPLNEPLAGEDEIGTIDQTFHDMARALTQVEQLKQDFVNMISHDLRTPLTSIQASLSMLETGQFGELTQQGTSLVSISEREVGRLVRLINQLLDVDKIASGNLDLTIEDTTTRSIIEQSVNSVATMAKRKKIEIITPAASIDLKADAERLVQVAINLISNALKFSKSGTSITIETESSNGFVEFRITDQGRGVPKELQSKIFERYKQTEKADATEKGGSGLGLYICKMIIEAHNGQIGVRSEPGQGSTFWFRVPIS